MDQHMLAVKLKPAPNAKTASRTTRLKKHNNNNCNDNKKLKVVYISSPMKVKTSASNFRALVQELTGRDSDITRYDASYFDPITSGADADATTTTTNTEEGGSSVDGKSFLDEVFRFDELEGMFPTYSF